MAEILLDKTAWEAIGKIKGCVCTGDIRQPACSKCGGWTGNPWQKLWHHFIDQLVEGNDINVSLDKIL